MNVVFQPACEGLVQSSSPPIRPLGDITDPFSGWYDLRVAEMTGYDYVFAPVALCDIFSNKAALQDFLLHAQALLGFDADRTILINYRKSGESYRFCRYNLDWNDGRIIDSSLSDLSHSAQLDFIELMFQHSEKLTF